MEQVFIWTGFICLMAIILAAAVFAVFFFLELIINKTKVLEIVFKRIANFYSSFPVPVRKYKYIITVYDIETGKFIDSTFLNEYGETDEEAKKVWDWIRKKHAKKRVD